MPISKIENSSIEDTAIHGARNLIINGAMQVAQRGTSVAAPPGISYTLDRFIARPNSSTATTVTQVTDAPSGFQYSARVTRDSGQTGTLTRFETAFETKDIIRLRGQRVTISFYAKAGSGFTPSALSVLLFEGNGTERARAITSYDNETTLANSPKTLTTSWQRFTHTTTAEIASDTTQLALQFNVSWSGTAPANDEYFITGIQLEVGDVATPFEHESYAATLQKCQRYFQKRVFTDADAIWVGANFNATSAYGVIEHIVTMRTEPSGAYSGTLADYKYYSAANTKTPSAMTINSRNSENSSETHIDWSGDLNSGGAGWLRAVGTNAFVQLEAEL